MLTVFFPGAHGANQAHLTDAGLADLAADQKPSFVDFRGPEGAGGMLAYWGQELPAADAAAYEWSPKYQVQSPKSEDSKPYQLGKLKGETIDPQSLERKQKQPGRDLVLADGQAWHVPAARQLPRVLGLDEAGNWTGVIDRRYEEFWNQSWRMLSELSVTADGQARVRWTEAIDFAAAALAINYRVNREIVGFLNLLRTDLVWPIVQIVVEFEDIARALAEKKTDGPASDSPASSAGGAG